MRLRLYSSRKRASSSSTSPSSNKSNFSSNSSDVNLSKTDLGSGSGGSSSCSTLFGGRIPFWRKMSFHSVSSFGFSMPLVNEGIIISAVERRNY
uniref:Uncharacterized protein n=1 Tax=Schistosoma japonicum TaxID=6182 RepID=Q5BYM3_SCHJA|nr:unknown [Schistosoma japonicum]